MKSSELNLRKPTENERLYIINRLKKRRSELVFTFYFGLTLTIVCSAGTLICFGQRFNIGTSQHILGVILALLTVICGGLIYLSYFWIKRNWSGLDMEIVSIEGEYRRRRIGSPNFPRTIDYIGDYSFELPDHWYQYLAPGDHLQAEAFFYPAMLNNKTGVIKSKDPVCVLVSLNGIFQVDQEVSRGLLRIKLPISLFCGLFFGLIAFGLTGILSEAGYSPLISYEKLQYNHMEAVSYQTVGDLVRTGPRRGAKIRIVRAALAPNLEEKHLYLVDPVAADREYVNSLRREVFNENISDRLSLLPELEATPGIRLMHKEAWERFELFSDNPLYEALKQRYLVEGKNSFHAGFQIDRLTDYRDQFIHNEKERIKLLENERQELFRTKLAAFYREISTGRPSVRLTPAKSWECEDEFDNRLSSLLANSPEKNMNESFSFRTDIRGRLEITGKNELIINQQLEKLDKANEVVGWLFLAALGLALILGTRGFFVLYVRIVFSRAVNELYDAER